MKAQARQTQAKGALAPRSITARELVEWTYAVQLAHRGGTVTTRHGSRMSQTGRVTERLLLGCAVDSKAWVKTKCSLHQEFAIAGYVPSTVSSRMIGALALGYYDDGKLVYAGRVGTGFTHKVAGELFQHLDPRAIAASPFAQRLPSREAKGLRFVRPDLVCEVAFRAWTGEGYVRHASFRGLREDKLASEVVLEKAVETREASK